MSLERLKHVAIALVVLVFLWGAAEMLRGGMDEANGDFALATITLEGADSVWIGRTSDTVIIVKQTDTEWSVNGLQAAFSGVSDFFGVFGEVQQGEVVAQNPGSHERLQVAEDNARQLRVFGGDELLLELFVGKRGRDFQSFYVRRPEENEVYALRSRLISFVDRQLNDWRDRTITSVESDSIASVELARGRNRFSVTKEDGEWRYPDGQTPDSAAITQLLEGYRALNAAGFPTPQQEDSVNFSPPDRRAILRDAAGNVLSELLFDSTSAGFWVMRAEGGPVYRLDRFRVDRIVPADSALRGDSG
jgi:hypothetical protein